MMATNVATALEIEGRDHIGRATVTLLRMNRDGRAELREAR